ncbi:pentapeptide repeat-containing protein [Martelella sp. HB161492]|uniref:pentapeptide repeat-containing protein n=1 Tax=Martelella sp. HB161492 TaxID=2720726 RepID=UPI0015924197|nr:pentapeptide repeat-containing protein [Martelella sp. HB161492]
MDEDETRKLFSEGKSAWNRWANGLLREKPDTSIPTSQLPANEQVERERLTQDWQQRANVVLRKHIFEQKIDFSGWLFPGFLTFDRVEFAAAISFNGCEFSAITFHGVAFKGQLDLSRCQATELKFFHARFHDATDFSGSHISQEFAIQSSEMHKPANWKGMRSERKLNLSGSTFHEGADLSEAMLEGTVAMQGSKFHAPLVVAGKDLHGSNFRSASLHDADFTNTNLEDANFTGADLTNANLLGAHTNTKTIFEKATADGCRINRYALECLKDYGELSDGARMKMAIQDDVAILRQRFSGYLRWMHLVALVAFIFPYAWFLLSKWGEARFFDNPAVEHITLAEALCRYIYNGGVNWETGFDFSFSFVIFILGLLFNCLRGIMLWKTKTLEFQEEVRGVRVDFSLVDPIFEAQGLRRLTWGTLQKIADKAVLVYFLIVASNTVHFLMMDIPV